MYGTPCELDNSAMSRLLGRKGRTILYSLGKVKSAVNMVRKARNRSSKKSRPIVFCASFRNGFCAMFSQNRPAGTRKIT